MGVSFLSDVKPLGWRPPSGMVQVPRYTSITPVDPRLAAESLLRHWEQEGGYASCGDGDVPHDEEGTRQLAGKGLNMALGAYVCVGASLGGGSVVWGWGVRWVAVCA